MGKSDLSIRPQVFPQLVEPEIQHGVVLLHLLWGGFGLCPFLLWLDEATREEVVVKLLDIWIQLPGVGAQTLKNQR